MKIFLILATLASTAFCQVSTNVPSDSIRFATNTAFFGKVYTISNGVFIVLDLAPPDTNAIAIAKSHVDAIRKDSAMAGVVAQLASEGELCKLKGHWWRSGRPGEEGRSFLDYHPHVEYRTCKLCGNSEQRATW